MAHANHQPKRWQYIPRVHSFASQASSTATISGISQRKSMKDQLSPFEGEHEFCHPFSQGYQYRAALSLRDRGLLAALTEPHTRLGRSATIPLRGQDQSIIFKLSS
jgi:hypothetical protein